MEKMKMKWKTMTQPPTDCHLPTKNKVEIGYLSSKHVERNLREEVVELNENTTSRLASCCYRRRSGSPGDSDAKERVIVVSKHEFLKRGVEIARRFNETYAYFFVIVWVTVVTVYV
jgi:hypothetical protein